MRTTFLLSTRKGAIEFNQEETIKMQSDTAQTNYMKWIIDNGGVINNVHFPAAFGKEPIIGIKANETIPPEALIASIPAKLILSLDLIRASELKELFQKNNFLFYHGKESDNVSFALYLLYLYIKGKSFWTPYIQRAMAKDFEQPYQWSEELLKEYDSLPLMYDMKGYAKQVESEWEKVKGILQKCPDLFPPDKVKREIYMLLYKYVATHTFGGKMPCTMIVPFGECLNHNNDGYLGIDVVRMSSEPKVEEEKKEPVVIPKTDCKATLKTKHIWHAKDPEYSEEDEKSEEEDEESESEDEEEEKKKSLLVTKIHSKYPWWKPALPDVQFIIKNGHLPIPKDGHISYSYGKRSNHELLMDFGFLLMPNKQDRFKIVLWNNINPKINLKESGHLALVKNEIAARILTNYKTGLFDTEDELYKEQESTTTVVQLKWSHLPSRGLMGYIRKHQMMHFKGEHADSLLISNPLVPAFEIECLQIAIELMERRKKLFKTTIEEDRTILEECNKGSKWRWAECIYYRLGQKNLLEMHIQSYKLLIDILKNISETGAKYKEAYMKMCPKYEKTEDEVMENRMLFRTYIRQLAQFRKTYFGVPYDS